MKSVDVLKYWVELEISRTAEENRLVDLNAMLHILNGDLSHSRGTYLKAEWNALCDGIDEIIDNRMKGLMSRVNYIRGRR